MTVVVCGGAGGAPVAMGGAESGGGSIWRGKKGGSGGERE